jgi:hypothetical protein
MPTRDLVTEPFDHFLEYHCRIRNFYHLSIAGIS